MNAGAGLRDVYVAFRIGRDVLAGAQLLGPAGALLALPGAAVVQAIIGALAPARPREPSASG